MDTLPVDVLVIGGGINGAGVAAQAASAGLSVVLCEQGDFACATSSASTKLIHGGLRYLEQFAFRLVRESLHEREVLMKKAPHLVRPLRFIMPHGIDARPTWMIRLGLFLYDHLSSRDYLPPSKKIALSSDTRINPLNLTYREAFEYSDCFVNDARLVISNVLAAHEHGAVIMKGAQCTKLIVENDIWVAHLQTETGEKIIRAKSCVNATGPWISDFLLENTGMKPKHTLRWVKGSHIVTRQLYQGDHAYILQNKDKRVVFAIPYLKHFTLIGTTDFPYVGNLGSVDIEPDEIYYLCDAINRYFHRKVKPSDIIHSWSGVRPLIDDATEAPSKVSREYVLDDQDEMFPPMVNVYGGKLTTYRALSEKVVDMLAPHFEGHMTSVNPHTPLPGGDLPTMNLDDYVAQMMLAYPWIPASLITRLAHLYGTRMTLLLQDARDMNDLGMHFGHGFFEREIDFLCETEWATTLEDILWRRTSMGLRLSSHEMQFIKDWAVQHKPHLLPSAQ